MILRRESTYALKRKGISLSHEKKISIGKQGFTTFQKSRDKHDKSDKKDRENFTHINARKNVIFKVTKDQWLKINNQSVNPEKKVMNNKPSHDKYNKEKKYIKIDQSQDIFLPKFQLLTQRKPQNASDFHDIFQTQKKQTQKNEDFSIERKNTQKQNVKSSRKNQKGETSHLKIDINQKKQPGFRQYLKHVRRASLSIAPLDQIGLRLDYLIKITQK